MTLLLGLVLLAFAVTSVFMVPFIDLLYYLKRRFEKKQIKQKSETPIHDLLMKGDENTPSGGGILLTLILVVLSIGIFFFNQEADKFSLVILLLTVISFGSLGLIDDIKLIITRRKGKFLGLGRKRIILIQTFLALVIAALLYFVGGLNNFYIAGLGNLVLNAWYVPIAAFVIVSFANAWTDYQPAYSLSA
jgi:UDP-N-acetylmuramyl pentapeptide phosphotransferase/UDP-N-acetylglucosamine-1-phosphate transferase